LLSIYNSTQEAQPRRPSWKCETLLNFQNQKREFEIQDFHAVKIHIVVSCSLVGGYHVLEEHVTSFVVHPEDGGSASLKLLYPPTRLHGIITCKD
jgi:hypothetical protein